jgi:hypothetical protein
MTNLPYLTIYKGDFLRGNVSACSIAAQGLWFRIMILMHDSERAGYLCLNGEAMPSRIAAIKCAVSVDEYETLLAELKSVCAFNTSREGIIFSPEIVAQAEERAKNAERQRNFKEKRSGNGQGNGKVTPQVTEESHPSSSSLSSSPSGTEEKDKPIGLSKKKIRIPSDFAVNENMLTWANKSVPGLDTAHETEQFIDHFTAKGETTLDWSAKWRTWMRNAFTDFGKFPNGKPSINGNGKPAPPKGKVTDMLSPDYEMPKLKITFDLAVEAFMAADTHKGRIPTIAEYEILKSQYLTNNPDSTHEVEEYEQLHDIRQRITQNEQKQLGRIAQIGRGGNPGFKEKLSMPVSR